MPATRAEAVFVLLCELGRPIILDRFREDSCVVTTRVAIEVLRNLGYPAKPIAAKTFISNASAVESLAAGRPLDIERGDWTIGIGIDGAEPGFVGHLVALVRGDGNRYLLDMTLDQASRPEHDLELVPSAFLLPSEWEEASGEIGFSGQRGEHIVYVLDPENDAYRRARDWTDAERRADIVDYLTTLCRDALDISTL